jgi:hypothetical protein
VGGCVVRFDECVRVLCSCGLSSGRSGNESTAGADDQTGGGDVGASTSSHNYSVANVDRKAYDKTCKLMDQVCCA